MFSQMIATCQAHDENVNKAYALIIETYCSEALQAG